MLPLTVKSQDTSQPPEFILLLNTMSEGPITCSDIRTWTRQDPLLSTVLRHTQMGWPLQCPEEELKLYWSKEGQTCFIRCLYFVGLSCSDPRCWTNKITYCCTKVIQAYPEWNPWHVQSCGGQELIMILKLLSTNVVNVNWFVQLHQLHPYSWRGQLDHGPAFIWTLPDHFSTTCF